MLAHLDADAFFASVLQRKHPHLKGKALIALGMGGSCVIAASYQAKAKGVKTGMSIREAIKLCPEAIRMPSDFRETGLASKQIEDMLKDICPIVEQYSIDEWFLDLASRPGGSPLQPEPWAKELQQDIKRRADISVSIGIAPSKLLAKMASEYRKPAGVTALEMTDIEAFLKDRPAAAIPGIGRKRQVHADALHWNTAWDFANADRDTVQTLFGRPGPELQRELLGERISGVLSDDSPPKSVSRTRTFRVTNDKAFLWAHVLHHTQYVILRMRRHGLACRGVSVWLRDRNYKHSGANCSLPQAFSTEEELTAYVKRCFEQTYRQGTAYNQAGMALWALTRAQEQQMSLFEDAVHYETNERLQASLDRLRQRYGRDVIARGSALPVKSSMTPGLPLPVYEAR